MSARGVRILWLLLGAGVAARVILAFATHGSVYDIDSFRIVADQLAAAPLDLYAAVDPQGQVRWPYPTLYFPWIAGVDGLADATGLAFHGLIGLPAIAADAAIAWIVQDFLGRRGAGERTRLAAAALVAIGPSFAAISGYHGHMDSLAILPAVAAVSVWERMDGERRAVVAGLLIGSGAALKTVPILMLLALLPSCRDRRESLVLVGSAVAVPFVLLLPWLLSTPTAVLEALRYTGVPGAGGLTLAVQPEAAANWLTRLVEPNAPQTFIFENRGLVNFTVVAALAAFLLRNRTAPVTAAVIVWLAFYVAGTGFFFQYLVWGLPFIIMAGHLRAAAAVQVLALVPSYLFYAGPWESEGIVVLYATLMLALWAGFVVALVVLGRRELATARQAGFTLRWPAPRVRLLPAEGRLGRLGLGAILTCLAGWGLLPFLGLVARAAGEGGTFAGSDGPFVGDQLQYLAWVRDAGEHVLAQNTFDTAPSDHVFLHPMFTLSGLAWKLFGRIELWVVVWKPVAIAVLFIGFLLYVRRMVDGRLQQWAALVLALFFAAPAAPLAEALGAGPERMADLYTVLGELAPALQLWGYLPTAIALGLMPLFLLGVERLLQPDLEARSRRRLLVLTSAAGALAAWLHPWQGETLVVVLAGLAVWGGLGERRRMLVIPAAATIAPIAYYFLLSRFDESWKFAQAQNEVAHLPPEVLVAGLAPLALLALLGLRRPEGPGEWMLVLWPPATLLTYLLLSPSVPAHALEGISLPLAVLAARGLPALRGVRALTRLSVVVLTVPGMLWVGDSFGEVVRARTQPFHLESGERAALRYTETSPREGGVLTSSYLGQAVPAFTGRQVWAGHASWTPGYAERATRADQLVDGKLGAAEARRLLREARASFVIADCRGRPDLRRMLDGSLIAVRPFGCARVYEVAPG